MVVQVDKDLDRPVSDESGARIRCHRKFRTVAAKPGQRAPEAQRPMLMLTFSDRSLRRSRQPMQADGLCRCGGFLCEHSRRRAMGGWSAAHRSLAGRTIRTDRLLPCRQAMRRQPVCRAGRCKLDRGFMLHQPLDNWNSTLAVSDDTGDHLARYSGGGQPGRGLTCMLVTLGYAGWGAGQLEQELAQNAWLTVPVIWIACLICRRRIASALPCNCWVLTRWRCRARLAMPDVALPQGALLGFDFGQARIGVALGNTGSGDVPIHWKPSLVTATTSALPASAS